MSTQQQRLLVHVTITLVAAAFFGVTNAGYNRERCYSVVKDLLGNGSLATNDSAFYRDHYGQPMSDPGYPILTIAGCDEFCGKGRGWYVDIGPRLSTWLIPVFLLLSNVEVSPLDKRRYLMIVHLLGDPIDSLWCLLLKIEAWSRCYRLALYGREGKDERHVRNLATVLGGIEELSGNYAHPLEVYNTIRAQTALEDDELQTLIGRTAQQLADSRSDERLRTLLATALYFYQLVSAFVTTVGGGNTSPPGGRIGTTMFMTWVIPTILLSNAVGGFTSVRVCYNILETFYRDATSRSDLWAHLVLVSPAMRRFGSVEEYFDSLCWAGGIYTYRRRKRVTFGSCKDGRSASTLLLLAMSPVVVSSIIASVILWNTPPIGLNCRNYLIFSIVIFFALSTFWTWLSAFLPVHDRVHWHMTLIKDGLIGIPSVVLIFLATAGLFNTCWCWSGVYSLRGQAHVPLNPISNFLSYDRTTYPVLVGVCLLLQLLAFAAMMRVGWAGWSLMRWSEDAKRTEWREARRGKPIHRTAKPLTDVTKLGGSISVTEGRAASGRRA
ncbi:hypothetical protein K491DRAFT_126087 [Lophiostoma macrostomum CBS 122681]|uniref:Uncharacterized protein n=1 Tax=Lophiostoma macrostomum CBS 122681 TaxID=1314788 RepID=A0A6A6SSE6_9PLEO|nr:hypothetical protein K491DRAFT_126087 [Lophiostoma macrostomum CBS 122681]